LAAGREAFSALWIGVDERWRWQRENFNICLIMMFGDIKIKSRPLRLAFLIRPDKDELRKAIQINSTLWGGAYNPIVPLYHRAPEAWRLHPTEKISIEKRVLGYLRAFDPDFIVGDAKQFPKFVASPSRPIISIDEIWEDFNTDPWERRPSYGVGIFELLHAIYKEYFEVERRFPYKVVLPTLPKKHELFWAAAVGELPTLIQNTIEAYYADAVDFDKPDIGATNFASILKPHSLYPRRITSHKLKSEVRGHWRGDSYGFYMDITRVGDVVDYWNLRAVGRTVIPIAKQFTKIPEFLEFVRDFVKSRYRVSRQNPIVTYGTSIVRSSSCDMAELQELAGKLEPTKMIPGNPSARVLSLQHWYPRIWDEWAMGKDGAIPDDVSYETREYSFQDSEGTLSFSLLKPDFVSDGYSRSPRYANELYPKFYGQVDPILADVLPYDHGNEVLRIVGGPFLDDELRIGHTGAVSLVNWRSRTHWKLPVAEEVFFAWLKDKGFDAELSTCGRVAKQINIQLEGWINVLTNEPLIELLDKMNSGGEDGKGAQLGHVKNALNKVDSSGRLYRSLVEHGVFQLGYKTQCTHCHRSSWHNLSSLAMQLVCPLCHKKLDAISAVDRENKGDWHLKTAGPFSIGSHGDGSYCVLLGLNFFKKDHSLQTTPVSSFTAKHGTSGKTLEADFALMWQETAFGETQEGVLFAECKSYNEFQKKDVDRMEELAKEFPGAILAFCTLRKTLNASEIKLLKQLTKKGMKYWKTERPITPVLILTGHELFDHFGPPHCWKTLAVPDWAKRSHTILEFCNATQGIYLGLPNWQETWRKEFERKRQKKKLKREYTL
jgi:hypothetical protein